MARDTSIRVFHEIQASGVLSEARWQAYEWLYQHGPATGAEMDAALCSTGHGHAHKRLTELVQSGCVRAVGKRPCKTSGHTAYEYDVVSRLPDPAKLKTLPAKGLRPGRRDLAIAVNELLAIYRERRAAGMAPSQQFMALLVWLRSEAAPPAIPASPASTPGA